MFERLGTMNVVQTRMAPIPPHTSLNKNEFNSFYDSELLTVKGKVRIKCERLVYCFDEKYSCE